MADKTLMVTVISPEETLYSGAAEAVFLPGGVAPFEVLPGHAPIISTLRPEISWCVTPGRRNAVSL